MRAETGATEVVGVEIAGVGVEGVVMEAEAVGMVVEVDMEVVVADTEEAVVEV